MGNNEFNRSGLIVMTSGKLKKWFNSYCKNLSRNDACISVWCAIAFIGLVKEKNNNLLQCTLFLHMGEPSLISPGTYHHHHYFRVQRETYLVQLSLIWQTMSGLELPSLQPFCFVDLSEV